ncbi:MAG TPA: head GIN domain-containing protein [Kaistella chaponensis]|jgi:hypothetical protein|uniref:head GIN domain-containing protein n=1 Tax=Kaistella chaponensis TaxID=713588 RepID=UPI002BCA7D07|nr:head GIN domain-containing protein [Kaistella chaponensis]HPW89233.1 head GIN domain-containing protein [Kaistella chaponensis]
MNKLFGGFLFIFSQFFFAQSARNVGDFSSLKVYDKISVVLIHSTENKVETDRENADLETVNKNGELKIRMAPAKILQGNQVSVKVFYKNLNDIQASQGSVISAEGEVESNMLSLTSNEGSSINIAVNSKTLSAKLNSGGEITVTGNAGHQEILVNSGAKFLGKNIESESASVTTNAGGFAEVNVTDSVNATTRAGGVIDIYGDPNDRKVKNVIGGKINFK